VKESKVYESKIPFSLAEMESNLKSLQQFRQKDKAVIKM